MRFQCTRDLHRVGNLLELKVVRGQIIVVAGGFDSYLQMSHQMH